MIHIGFLRVGVTIADLEGANRCAQNRILLEGAQRFPSPAVDGTFLDPLCQLQSSVARRLWQSVVKNRPDMGKIHVSLNQTSL